MNEYLVVRLGVEPTDPVNWLVWSQIEQGIIASGTLAGAAELVQLQERAGGRPIIGLAPASELLFREVTLPGRLNRQTIKALPFLLEEQIASDVESLHLVVLSSQERQVKLVAVDKERMSQWLTWFAEAGLTLKTLVPDVLTLPLAVEGEWSAVELNGHWLVRQSEWAGLQAEPEWLSALFITFDPPPVVISYSTPPRDCSGEWRSQPAELALQLMAQGALTARGNLLTGPYRKQPEWQRLLQPWRKVALVAGLFLTLLLGDQLLMLRSMQKESQQLKLQTVQLYQQLFPGEKRVINPKQQLNQHLKALSGHSSHDGFLRQLMKLVPMFAQLPTLRPDQLRYDDTHGEIRLQATADGYQDFDRFRQLVAQQFEVKPGDMKSEGGKVQGTLLLRSKS